MTFPQLFFVFQVFQSLWEPCILQDTLETIKFTEVTYIAAESEYEGGEYGGEGLGYESRGKE